MAEEGGSTRNLSPHLDNNCTSRICLIKLFWNPGVCWSFATSRGRWMINCGPFQSIAAITTVVATYPPPSAMCQASCTCIPGAACTELAGVRVSKEDPVLKIWVIRVLAVCWLCKEVSSSYCCITLHCCNPLFLWPKWFPEDLKGWCPSSYRCPFSFLILLGTRYYQTKTFRNNCMYGGI